MRFNPFTNPDDFDVVGESFIASLILLSFIIFMEIV